MIVSPVHQKTDINDEAYTTFDTWIYKASITWSNFAEKSVIHNLLHAFCHLNKSSYFFF